MEFELNKAISFLERTPSILTMYLKDFPTEWAHSNEGDNTWSPFDIVGHLVHGEKTDWVVRAKIILDKNNHNSFEPFDRFAQFKDSKGKSLNQLLEEFEELRLKNLEWIKAIKISEEDLLLKGTHPELGEVTLKQLLSTWVTHDINHLGQISRVLAKQFQTLVGPWANYIGILKQ